MKLLEPLDIQGMKVPNRIMVPAMVTRLASEDGFVTDEIFDRYVRYAEGETGLIVVEAMAIHQSKSGPLLRISDDKFIPGLKRMTDRIHEVSDSMVVPQIIHFLKVAKSGWRQTLDMLTEEDIERIIEEFGDAVLRAKKAGFDGAELHSAHAYTLASFMTRTNPRTDEYGGKSIESRVTMIGRVMENVRKKVGPDFPVGIRFLADEFIKDGTTIDESKLIALRLAQLGFAYLSVSVGGKFEDAIHKEGHVPYPYTGYSGDRCMPGDWYPPMLHVHLAAEIKSFIKSKGYDTPVIVAGKISEPDDARQVIESGDVDMVAIARGLLADPDFAKKIRLKEEDRIVKCDYCNVCKALDGAHKPVHCFLWPRDATQAPGYDTNAAAPYWSDKGANLKVEMENGAAKLSWSKAENGPTRYDIYRTADDGEVVVIDAVKTTKKTDRSVLGGINYRYYVRACNERGDSSGPSNVVEFKPAVPAFQ